MGGQAEMQAIGVANCENDRDGARRAVVLVATSDPWVGAALVAQLGAAGYVVSCTNDGGSTLQSADRQPPDLVIADTTLPGLGGAMLARRLRERGHGSPLLLTSGQVPIEDVVAIARRTLGAGAGAAGLPAWSVDHSRAA